MIETIHEGFADYLAWLANGMSDRFLEAVQFERTQSKHESRKDSLGLFLKLVEVTKLHASDARNNIGLSSISKFLSYLSNSMPETLTTLLDDVETKFFRI
ncbi:MAG: hypothetical protein A4S09_13600 [Proteobacteria bacterium SG_bin7]|nr:MAG: hypothetical protein A4S09_13600 [Proteobacteria bacterium SG_bin7]